MRGGTLSRFTQQKKKDNHASPVSSLLNKNKASGKKRKDELPVRGCMSNLTEEQISELGKQELQRLPALVVANGDEKLIKFSCLLPKENGGGYPVLPRGEHSKQGERVVKTEPESYEKERMENAHIVCAAVGLSSSIGTASEQLPVGYMLTNEDDASVSSAEGSDLEMNVDEVASNAHHLPAKSFNPVADVAWENSINWGDDDAASSNDSTDPTIATMTTGTKNKKKTLTGNYKSKKDDDSESDDDDIDDIVFDSQTKKASSSDDNSNVVQMPDVFAVRPETNEKAWKGRYDDDNEENMRPEVKQNEVALERKLATPINSNLKTGSWLDQVVWDEEPVIEQHVVIDTKTFGAPFLFNMNDARYPTREEVEAAYGPDMRPGGNRTTDSDLMLKKEEVVDIKQMNRKELKKYTKDGRKRKLRAHGYFRFIDELVKRNDEDTKGVRDRLRCKRLPDIPKTVVIGHYKAEMRASEARSLHRPKFPKQSTMLRVAQPVINNRDGGVRQYRQKWNRADLSGAKGPVSLFEYMEERPPLLCNVGMASILCNFYQCDRPIDENFIPPTFEGGGKTVVLEPGDRSPFFAILKPNQRYTAICNDLVVAPVSEHKVSKTDFLLVRKKSNADGSNDDGINCYLRNIKSMYLVGQTEPRREVFHPSYMEARTTKKTKMRDFLDIFLDYQITRKFLASKRRGIRALQPTVLRDMFKLIGEGMVVKSLTRVAVKMKGGVFELRDYDSNSDIHLRDQLPAFSICQYESLQAGLQRLQDLGVVCTSKCDITRVMHANAILIDFYQLKEAAAHALREAARIGGTSGAALLLKDNSPSGSLFQQQNNASTSRVVLSPQAQLDLHTAQFIVDELQLTPWYLTTSYASLRSMEKPQLKLTGLGDPSGRMEAISYLPANIDGLSKKGAGGRRRRQNATQGALATAAAIQAVKAAASDEKKSQAEEKKKKADKYGGTDRDLRGLTLDDGEKILRHLGHTKDEITDSTLGIQLLDRWDRIMLIEEYASAAGGTDNIPVLSKFARNARKLSEKELKERDVVQRKVNSLFERQRTAISSTDPPVFLSQTETEEEKRKRKQLKKEKKILRKKKEKEKKRREKEKIKKKEQQGDDEDEEEDDEEEEDEESEPDILGSDESSSSSSSSSEDDDEDDSDSSDEDSADDQQAQMRLMQSLKAAATTAKKPDTNPEQKQPKKKPLLGNSNEDGEAAHLELFKASLRSSQSQPSEEVKKQQEAAIKQAEIEAERRQIPPPASWAGSSRKIQVVKRTIIEQLPNGENEVRIEFVKSSSQVRRVQQEIRDRANRKFRQVDEGRTQTIATSSMSAAERKRAEKLRANGRKLYEEYQENLRKYGKDWPSTVPSKPGDKKRCRVCGLPGHSQNSKKQCPLYFVKLENNSAVKIKDDSGMKLSISRMTGKKGIKDVLKRKRQMEKRDGKEKKAKRGHGRRTGPLSDLRDKLKKLFQTLYRMEEAAYFRKKVDRKLYPTYYDVVKDPMYFDKILRNIDKLQYISSLAFLEDIKLIHKNSIKFNGVDHAITKQANVLVETCRAHFQDEKQEFDKLDQAVKDAGITAPAPAQTKRRKTPQLFKNKSPGKKSGLFAASAKPGGVSGKPPLLQQQSSISIDPFQMDLGSGGGTVSDFFTNASPMPSSSPSPHPSKMAEPSPSPFPMPSPSPGMSSPLNIMMSPQPSPSPGADLMDLDLEKSEHLVEEIVEEMEEEEVLD